MNEREYHDEHYADGAAAIEAGALFQRVHDRSVRQFLRATGAGRAHRVLSLGCGTGSIERRLAPHVGEIVGLDISAVAVAQATAAAKAAGLGNLAFGVWEAQEGPLQGHGQFDLVAAFAFLHHLDDAAIRNMALAARKVLRRGGHFFAADPSCRRLVGLFTPLVRASFERYHSPQERALDPEGLGRLIMQAGFSRPAIGYGDYFLGPLAWLAPGMPAWLAGMLEPVDNLALRIPLVRRYASSFTLLAQAT